MKKMLSLFNLSINAYNGKRIAELDFFRRCAMLLVFMHHAGVWGGKYILAFHMPLFLHYPGFFPEIMLERQMVWLSTEILLLLTPKDYLFHIFVLNYFSLL